jgi:diaminohydroxyphosphoribosylaminopyrimidine deaminase/5-amino-6-(5-phosphoribosylamino)uracil reductase
MARALELARAPAFTSPNPRVGAVVVKEGRVVGEGSHEGAGSPHAEALALADIDARGATLYVNLEPCAHHGRTPPCAPATVAAGVTRVVAATADPDEQVAGRGFAALTRAGIELEVGILSDEAEALNAAYFHHRRTGETFVSLKLAQSLDGAIAAPDGSARWITGPEARRIVHSRRQEADAVMVGAGTVLADDPELTVRDVPAVRQPRRVVVDGSGRVTVGCRVFSGEGGPVLVATTERSSGAVRASWEAAGAEVLVLPQAGRGVNLAALVKELGTRDLVEILCEGGAELGGSLLEAGLVGRLELHYGPVILGPKALRMPDAGVATMSEVRRWRLERVERAGDDLIVSLRPPGMGL